MRFPFGTSIDVSFTFFGYSLIFTGIGVIRVLETSFEGFYYFAVIICVSFLINYFGEVVFVPTVYVIVFVI